MGQEVGGRAYLHPEVLEELVIVAAARLEQPARLRRRRPQHLGLPIRVGLHSRAHMNHPVMTEPPLAPVARLGKVHAPNGKAASARGDGHLLPSCEGLRAHGGDGIGGGLGYGPTWRSRHQKSMDPPGVGGTGDPPGVRGTGRASSPVSGFGPARRQRRRPPPPPPPGRLHGEGPSRRSFGQTQPRCRSRPAQEQWSAFPQGCRWCETIDGQMVVNTSGRSWPNSGQPEVRGADHSLTTG